MRKLIYITAITFVCIQSIYSQSIYVDSVKIPKIGLATKIFGGAYFYPSNFQSYPGPAGGASASIFIGRFEIEGGAYYFRKFDQTLPPDPTYPYQSVFHEGDYINGFILTNIKIAQVKKNVFSGYIGVGFRRNLNWNTDTLLNDGSHIRTENVKTSAERTVGVSLLAGVRYMHFFTPKICLVAGLDLAENLHNEYKAASGDHADSPNLFPPPPEPDFQIGFSVGIQFTLAGRPGTFYKY